MVPKRLVVVTNLFPNSSEPLRGLFNLQQLRALGSRIPLEVIAPVPWVPPLLRLAGGSRLGRAARVPQSDTIDGIRVYYPRWLLLPKIGRRLQGTLFVAGVRRTLRGVLAESGAKTVLATWAYPDVVGTVRSTANHGLDLVAKVHGSDINVQVQRPWCRAMVSGALQRCRAVVAVSEAIKKRVVELGVPATQVTVVPNGVDTARFFPSDRGACRAELGLLPERSIILFVGNLDPVKGLEVLLEAFRRLRGSGLQNPAQLVLLGDGVLRSWLERKIAASGWGAEVLLLGQRPHAEIPRWLGAADALCLPSRHEGSPNVVREALACGRPVVATRTGGIPELIRDGHNGYLVGKEDPGALAEALISGVSRLWNAEAIARTSTFSWSESADHLAHVLFGADGSQGAVPRERSHRWPS